MNKKILIIFLATVKIAVAQEGPVVELPTGRILGRKALTYANTTFYSFQKIPYATPPVGPLRFRAPQPAQSWTGTLDATALDVNCHQLQYNFDTDSEDCLVLNVYTPQLPVDGTSVSLPVMFYIHGGSFLIGSSLLYPGDLFVDNGVILVTINYRLGPFGFLSTGDETIPGNNGLKDQKLALQWTQENIHLFGGDPEKVTIFGLSAGSASVSYLLLDQDSNGLFSGGIMESGTCLSPWSYQRDARRIAFGTAAVLNPSFQTSNDSEALLQFLQSLDAEELDAASEQYTTNQNNAGTYDAFQGIIYAPMVEVKNPDAFLTRKMYGLLQEGSVLKVPIMVGFNSEEAVGLLPDPAVVQYIAAVYDAYPGLLVPNDMQINDLNEHTGMAFTIRDMYTNGQVFGNRLGEVIRYVSDNGYSRPITKYAELSSLVADTYFYQFSYDGPLGGGTVHYDGAESVGHSEEAYYFFCYDEACAFDGYPESDKLTSKRLVKLWTDFAKYQNPTPEPSELLQDVIWPKLSVGNGDFLYLDINEDLEIRNHPKGVTVAMWNDLYASLNFTDFDTY